MFSRVVEVLKKDKRWEYAIPILIGIALFVAICGPRVLNPMNLGAIETGGDSLQHYLGWAFYRNGDWTFPVGNNPDCGIETGSSLIYSDSLPLLAIPFKCLRGILPEPFQYYGWWYLACYVLGAFFSWKLLRGQGASRWIAAVGAVFAAASPMVVMRSFAHQSLGGQWLILFAFCLYFARGLNFKRQLALWCLLLSMAVATHAYLAFMVAAVWWADWCNRYGLPLLKERKLDLRKGGAALCIPVLVAVVTAWQVGYFVSTASPDGETGFGFYSLNLNTLFNPNGTSRFLQNFHINNGQSGGLAYLGAGGMLVVGLAPFLFFLGRKRNERSIFLTASPWMLVAGILVLLALAITNKVTFGHWVWLSAEVDKHGIFQLFRASNRFVWPLWYFLIFSSLLVFSRIQHRGLVSGRWVAVFMVMVVALQVGDFSKYWAGQRHLYMKPVKTEIFSHDESAWSQISKRYSEVRVLKGHGTKYPWWPRVESTAAQYKMKTNACYLARINRRIVAQEAEKDEAKLLASDYRADTAYIVPTPDMARVSLRAPKSAALRRVDGLSFLLPEWDGGEIGETWPALDKLLFAAPLGVKVYTNSNAKPKDWRKALMAGFSKEEKWGTWTDAKYARLAFIAPSKEGSLYLNVQPFLSGKLQEQRVIAKNSNGDVVYDERLGGKKTIVIPVARVLRTEENRDILELSFELPDAVSPSELGISGDPRTLGFGLIDFELKGGQLD